MRASGRWMGAAVTAAVAILASSTAQADPPPDAAPAAPAAPPAPPPAPAPEPEGPPRTPLPPLHKPEPVSWQRHLEVGGGIAFVILPMHEDAAGRATNVRLEPGVGFNVRLDWPIFRYLHVTGYANGASHTTEMPPGSLGLSNTVDISAPSTFVWTAGVRLSPTLPLTPRIRLWATVGGGWGRVEYGRIKVTQAAGGSFTIRERSAAIVDIPFGLGAAFEIVPNWLSVNLEVTGSWLPGQVGDAMQFGQAVDAQGHLVRVGPMPRFDSLIAQTLGLSLIL